METLYVYDDPKGLVDPRTDPGFSLFYDHHSIEDYDRKPMMLSGYYLTGYHDTPVKIGETAKLVFDERAEIVRIISIRFQFWNGDNDHNTNPSLDKYILKETIPSHKNWVRVQILSEEREDKINTILSKHQ